MAKSGADGVVGVFSVVVGVFDPAIGFFVEGREGEGGFGGLRFGEDSECFAFVGEEEDGGGSEDGEGWPRHGLS